MPAPTRSDSSSSTESTTNGVAKKESSSHKPSGASSYDSNLSTMSTSTATTAPTRAWLVIVCGIVMYAICQLDISVLSVSKYKEPVPAPTQQKIRQISIIGERNSGTRWTFDHLSKCFDHSLPIKIKFTRYKHWLQYPDFDRYPHDTLVLAQFRNPYDWFKAMQHVPHHAPNHMKYRGDKYWKEFLTKEWSMPRIGTDRWNNATQPCQEHFEWKDIISCAVEPLPKSYYTSLKYSNHQPIYEMRNDGSGEPYKNIMDLRADKIRNFLSVKDYQGVADVWVVQYEYLLTKGTQGLIDQVAAWTGLTPNCTGSPPQQRRNRPVEKQMAEYIRQHLNWTVESWIGYGPHQTQDQEESE
jgi:hypothetical protein